MNKASGERVVSGAMRVQSAAAFLGIRPSTFWRWVKEGKLPKGRHLSARVTVWMREDLERFLNQSLERAE